MIDIDASDHVGEESFKPEDLWDFVEEFKDSMEAFGKNITPAINHFNYCNF